MSPTPKGRGGPSRARGPRGSGPRPRGPARRRPDDQRAGGQRADERSELGGTQIEGRHAVRELLLVGRRQVRDVWLVEDLDGSPVIDDIRQLADEHRIPVRRVTRSELAAAAQSDAPQGVLAHAGAVSTVDLDELARPVGATLPFVVCLDGVTDPHNVGAILRTAIGAGVTGVVLPRHRAAHLTPTVAKAAAGAIEHLRFSIVSGLPSALARLSTLGVWVVGLDAGGSQTLFDLPVADQPVALVLGDEGSGLSRLVRARCDVVASIPLWGPLESLNVSVAGALACYEVARRRQPASGSSSSAAELMQ